MNTLTATSGRITLSLTAQRLGPDLNVSLYGGTHPHLGAVALAEPRPSLSGDGSLSASCSVISVCGHKDDELARMVALELAARLNCRVCVACGVHLDAITTEEIREVIALAHQLIKNIEVAPPPQAPPAGE